MRRDWLRSVWGGAERPADPWDEELVPQRAARESLARRRAILVSVVVLLLAAVTSVVVFGGDDSASETAKVSAETTVSGADATEGSFAPGLPTPVTAVSLGGQVVVPDPATTVPPPLTVPGSEPSGSSGPGGVAVGTLPGGEPVTTIPGANPPATTRPAGTPGTTGSGTTAPTTTAAPPTTQPPTTTAPPPPPPFTYDQPRPANGVFTNGQGSAGCSAPVPPERTGQFVLSTPTPGKLLIERAGAAGGASGPVDPSGLFHATSPAGEVYDGQASDAGANASYLQDDGAGCTVTYNVVFTFT